MFFRLLLLFIFIPLVEMVLLMLIADVSNSIWVPLGLVIATGVVGSWLARQQGYAVYRRIQEELAAGRMPTDAMIDAVMIFVAGVLLVTPGVLTDLFGITVFLPNIRGFYRRQLIAWFHRTFKVHTILPGGPGRGSQVVDSYVVEKQGDEPGE